MSEEIKYISKDSKSNKLWSYQIIDNTTVIYRYGSHGKMSLHGVRQYLRGLINKIKKVLNKEHGFVRAKGGVKGVAYILTSRPGTVILLRRAMDIL